MAPTPPDAPASTVLPWMVLAAAGQLFAGLAASALAALDDYVDIGGGYGSAASPGSA